MESAHSMQWKNAADDERQLMRSKPYRAVVGSLMYLMLGTRPDLAYLVRESSQFLENPGLLHWRALKRGLRYLKEISDSSSEWTGASSLVDSCGQTKS
ncbi:unnamed protein product [Phytophthora fragariaefolia]|uniref:Unnamed protein product n=1 Tax=Phytophthora fragariaefolia TaxID=1490495 RepID=A0A9W7DA86_9STRA|nr:unnamed protein product [Phytophthora fragariaefolia]